jgi:hypothetical protein
MARKHKNGERRKRVTRRVGGDPNGSEQSTVPTVPNTPDTVPAQQIAPATVTNTSISPATGNRSWSFPNIWGTLFYKKTSPPNGSSSNTSPQDGTKKEWYKFWGGRRTFKNHNKTMKRPRTMRVVKTSKPHIVVGRIYSDSCGFCVAMKDDWEKMKNKIATKKNVEFADIEAQEMDEKLNMLNARDLSEKVAIQGGFPTLFKIRDGKVEYYSGKRSADAMYKWYMK